MKENELTNMNTLSDLNEVTKLKMDDFADENVISLGVIIDPMEFVPILSIMKNGKYHKSLKNLDENMKVDDVLKIISEVFTNIDDLMKSSHRLSDSDAEQLKDLLRNGKMK